MPERYGAEYRKIGGCAVLQSSRICTPTSYGVYFSKGKPIMNEKPLANPNQENDKTLSRREMVGRIGMAGAVPAVVAVVAATTQAHAQSSVTSATTTAAP